MDGEIISRDLIQAKARAAADRGQNVDVTNPYPTGTAAFELWELAYWSAVGEVEVCA